MAFFVYLFVLLVAAGSVIFGLDWTQSPLRPPAYATPTAQTTTGASPPAPTEHRALASAAMTTAPKASALAPAQRPSESAGVAAHAEANAAEAQAEPATVADASLGAHNHCAVDACAAAYRSFRASDCTYQPYEGERRLCTKAATSGTPAKKIAAARTSVHHASRSGDLRRAYERTYAERDSERDGYGRRRRGWAFDLFGDAFGR